MNWTAKVELHINSGNFDMALSALDEIRAPLLRNGYSEEYVRWAVAYFSNVDPSNTSVDDQAVQDDTLVELVNVLSQLGRFDEAEDYIKRFERGVAGATARYVALCDMRSYLYWSMGEFEIAKEWGRRGVEVKNAGGLDTRHDCSHNLALAQRDSGDIEPALVYFLGGTSLDDVANPCIIDQSHGGSFYGNIGRCLYLMGDSTSAEVCFVKSAWLLEKAKDRLILLNQGWAADWLGDLYRSTNPEVAYVFYRRAADKWKEVSPQRAEKADAAAKELAVLIDHKFSSMTELQTDRKFRDWLEENRRF